MADGSAGGGPGGSAVPWRRVGGAGGVGMTPLQDGRASLSGAETLKVRFLVALSPSLGWFAQLAVAPPGRCMGRCQEVRRAWGPWGGRVGGASRPPRCAGQGRVPP